MSAEQDKFGVMPARLANKGRRQAARLRAARTSIKEGGASA
jgi:hypothetical protein